MNYRQSESIWINQHLLHKHCTCGKYEVWVMKFKGEEWKIRGLLIAYCVTLRNQPNLRVSVMIALLTAHCMLVEQKTRVAADLLCFRPISISPSAHFFPPGVNHHIWSSSNIPSWDFLYLKKQIKKDRSTGHPDNGLWRLFVPLAQDKISAKDCAQICSIFVNRNNKINA